MTTDSPQDPHSENPLSPETSQENLKVPRLGNGFNKIENNAPEETEDNGGSKTLETLFFIFLLFVPVSIFLNITQLAGEKVMFFTAAIALLGLAKLIGHATEEIAIHVGQTLGGLINATFGNVVELILAFFALKKGLHEMVLASLSGSIIGNILLVLGASLFLGGMFHPRLEFKVNAAALHLKMLGLAAFALLLPSVFHFEHVALKIPDKTSLAHLSLGTAVILFLIYFASLYFSFISHKEIFFSGEDDAVPSWSQGKALGVLLLGTLGAAYESEIIIHTVEKLAIEWGLSHMFIGVVLLAILGNAAEHASAVIFAIKNKVDVTLAICSGSSSQIALLVTPLLIFSSYLIPGPNGVPVPLNLQFSLMEITSIGASIYILHLVSQDGEFEWFEGFLLLSLYLIIALGFFFY